MKKLFVVIMGLSICTLSAADWKIGKHIDAMTGEAKKTAIVKNISGHTFSIYRLSENGPVWGGFSLSDRILDQVDWENPPVYRVDKNPPKYLARTKRIQEMGLGIQAYSSDPKSVDFLIWHGKEDEGIAKNLVRLLEGQRVGVRYYLGTGGYQDTSFSLKGAAPAISEAIGISSKIDRSAQLKSREFKQAYVTESRICQRNMKAFESCFARINDCRKKSGHNVAKFNLCLH